MAIRFGAMLAVFMFFASFPVACAGETGQALSPSLPSGRVLSLPFEYVEEATVHQMQLFGVPAKTLLLRFTGPQTVLSGLGGWQEGVLLAGNHSFSPESWAAIDCRDTAQLARTVLARFGGGNGVLMFTGADMDNLVYAGAEAEGLRVGVLATAGVAGNAMRASADAGEYVESGTINLLVLTNRNLSPAAMVGAVITATEAKTAALQDLDIRSSYSALAATGTGTDNVLIVSGTGPQATMMGGHTRLGELLGRAVHQAVTEAVEKQNGFVARRDVRQRLAERKIFSATLLAGTSLPPARQTLLAAALDETLAMPRYASFLLAALAVSDSRERYLVADTGAFSAWCELVAAELAGEPAIDVPLLVTDSSIPPLLREALNHLLAGLQQKLGE